MKTMIGYRHSTVGAAFLSTLIVASLLLFFPMMAHPATCGSKDLDLTAGQTINVGSVNVSNDANNIYVRFQINQSTQASATFGTLHLWIGDDLTLVDNGGNKRPAPGKLPFISDGTVRNGYSFISSTGSKDYTFTIPFSAINVTGVSNSTSCLNLPTLFIVAHAEVNGVNKGSGSLTNETAFAGDMPGAGSSWWFYDTYQICCDFGGGGVCITGTAFAKGGYVWTTDSKSNPEGLPSLRLSKNRWGWAINLNNGDKGISKTYDIWTGAGLNNTTKGVKVGTMTVNWDGLSANVTNNLMNSTYSLEEVHIYAGDLPPASMAYLAPGSFGNPTSGYNVDPDTENKIFTSGSIPLADTNGTGGVWLIVHAVVSNGFCD